MPGILIRSDGKAIFKRFGRKHDACRFAWECHMEIEPSRGKRIAAFTEKFEVLEVSHGLKLGVVGHEKGSIGFEIFLIKKLCTHIKALFLCNKSSKSIERTALALIQVEHEHKPAMDAADETGTACGSQLC